MTIVRNIAIMPIRAYQRLLSPLLPPSCRFYPTCSAYATTAIERYGVVRGGWLALTRVSRCHPWNPGGYDPVPGVDDSEDDPNRAPRDPDHA